MTISKINKKNRGKSATGAEISVTASLTVENTVCMVQCDCACLCTCTASCWEGEVLPGCTEAGRWPHIPQSWSDRHLWEACFLHGIWTHDCGVGALNHQVISVAACLTFYYRKFETNPKTGKYRISCEDMAILFYHSQLVYLSVVCLLLSKVYILRQIFM